MKQLFLIIIILLLSHPIFAQKKANTLRIVSYNVENYFDTKHDEGKHDKDFTPDGAYRWTFSRYKQKQVTIARVITAIGGWKPPAIVGLLEIENENALNALVRHSPLKNLRYKYIHKESPDRRGIDVAVLYQANQFKPIYKEFIEINFPDAPRSKTRDILYVAGILPNKDTLHIFMNHFPSRLGGEQASEPRRIFVASKLRAKADSIFASSPAANIVIMGDFNDYPNNRSLKDELRALVPTDNIQAMELYNLYCKHQERGEGSHKYQGEWGMLDQIIVSGNMLVPANDVFTDKNNAQIFKADFLLEDDEKFSGKKPFRTYAGRRRYLGGYSDHLPVYIDIVIQNQDIRAKTKDY